MTNNGIINCLNSSLGYQIEGSGHDTLVIGSSIYYPRLFSDNLRNHLRLIFVDNRAFAPVPSEEISLTFSLDLLLDDIECIRQALQLEKMIVIGHSGNAFLALEYAKKYPERVSQVIMIGTSTNFSEESNKSSDLNWEKHASEDRKQTLDKLFERYPDSEFENIPLNQQFIWNYLRHTPRIWFNYETDYSSLWKNVNVNGALFNYIWGELFCDIDITKNLETFDKSVLLVLGRHDYIVTPPDSWSPILPKFRNIEVKIFEESGHSPFYEQPELFDTTLLDWIT